MLSALQIFTAADVPIAWDEQDIAEQVDPRTNSFITRENLDSVLVRRRGLVYQIQQGHRPKPSGVAAHLHSDAIRWALLPNPVVT